MAQGVHYFGDIAHTLRAAVNSEGLSVSLEDQLTLDVWKGAYTRAFIEQLTSKTGSYKSFDVFVAMLVAAITKEGESVSLDFLKYDDVAARAGDQHSSFFRSEDESSRSRLSASLQQSPQGRRASVANGHDDLDARERERRYLVLTYHTEFDRVHFPLPLPSHVAPDVAMLQRTIRGLRAELQRQRSGRGSGVGEGDEIVSAGLSGSSFGKGMEDRRSGDAMRGEGGADANVALQEHDFVAELRARTQRGEQIDMLRHQLSAMMRQRDALAAELEARGSEGDESGRAHRKEVGVLKKIIAHMEEDLLAEKSR